MREILIRRSAETMSKYPLSLVRQEVLQIPQNNASGLDR
jgi:hypothetical protein